jgi:hypothetical protein
MLDTVAPVGPGLVLCAERPLCTLVATRESAQILALRRAVESLADHLSVHGSELGSVVRDVLTGEDERLPQRFLALFTHGMGGLLDVPFYSGGLVNRMATDERDRLAEFAFERARVRQSDSESGSARAQFKQGLSRVKLELMLRLLDEIEPWRA